MAAIELAGPELPWDGVAVCAATYRRAGLGGLGQLVLPADAVEARRALRDGLGVAELVFVATCNRVELYVAGATCPPAELRERAAAFFSGRGAVAVAGALEVSHGRDAVERLLGVACGLDSLLLGETEIAGQLERAHALARAEGLSGRVLSRLFERAAACARSCRALGLGRVASSAAAIAARKVERCFGARGPRVTVFVGAGETIDKVARGLAHVPGERWFVNRTRARAEALARRFGGRAVDLADLIAAPPAALDLLVTATAAAAPVVPASVLGPALAARRPEDPPLVVCDLGLPRDVDRAVDALPGVRVVDMTTIEAHARTARGRHATEVARAREVVRDEAARLEREERFRVAALEDARALVGERLAHLASGDREVVVRYAVGLAARLARQPDARRAG